MNNYVGYFCTHCGVQFKESDEVIICSSCGTTMHLECWIGNGGCTNQGCTGSPLFASNMNTQPVQEPYTAPIQEPYTAPVQEPYTAPVQEPYTAPVQEPYVEPVQEPYVAPVQEPYVEPVQEPYAAPIQEPYTAPVQEPYIAPVQEPYTAPVQEPYVAPVQEPYTAPVQEPYTAPVQEPYTAPVQEPYVAPVQEPYTAPVQEPYVEPVQEPYTQPIEEASQQSYGEAPAQVEDPLDKYKMPERNDDYEDTFIGWSLEHNHEATPEKKFDAFSETAPNFNPEFIQEELSDYGEDDDSTVIQWNSESRSIDESEGTVIRSGNSEDYVDNYDDSVEEEVEDFNEFSEYENTAPEVVEDPIADAVIVQDVEEDSEKTIIYNPKARNYFGENPVVAPAETANQDSSPTITNYVEPEGQKADDQIPFVVPTRDDFQDIYSISPDITPEETENRVAHDYIPNPSGEYGEYLDLRGSRKPVGTPVNQEERRVSVDFDAIVYGDVEEEAVDSVQQAEEESYPENNPVQEGYNQPYQPPIDHGNQPGNVPVQNGNNQPYQPPTDRGNQPGNVPVQNGNNQPYQPPTDHGNQPGNVPVQNGNNQPYQPPTDYGNQPDNVPVQNGNNQPQPTPDKNFKFCTQCGVQNNINSKFCVCCGNPFPAPKKEYVFCTQCGAKHKINQNFCTFCGKSLKK